MGDPNTATPEFRDTPQPEKDSPPTGEAEAIELLEIALRQLEDSVFAGSPPASPPARLSEIGSLKEFYSSLLAIRQFTLALANGDLSQSLQVKGHLAGALKSLQASLRHLTWQTQRIAEGDFSHRVDFMGEFSTAFNTMVERLQETRAENARLIEDIQRLAITDPLTGLFNRRHFFNVTTLEFERSRRYRNPVSLIMMDIDHFKHVNDQYGHTVGDQVLRAVASRCRETLRKTDVLGRYGGEEFIVLLPETGLNCARLVAERLRKCIADTPISVSDGQVSITVSLGVSGYSADSCPSEATAENFEKYINLADGALYRAKNGGRNQVVVSDPPPNEQPCLERI